jgi:hypothetical protein
VVEEHAAAAPPEVPATAVALAAVVDVALELVAQERAVPLPGVAGSMY